jgi:hypothetical protein
VRSVVVAIRVAVGDRDADEVGRRGEGAGQRAELVPVEPQRSRIADGGQGGLVEHVEVEVEPPRAGS